MKNKQHPLSVLLAVLCALSVMFSLVPSAVFADGESGEEPSAEGESESSADAGGQLIIGYVDGSAGENEGQTITISSAAEFEAFSRNCRSSAWSIGLRVMLEADLDFGGRSIMPVPSFSGTFFGKGHTIKNYYCASNGSHQGLFRYLEQDGRILDLDVSGTVMPDGSRSCVGGIVGTNRGSLVGCSFTGTVEGLISVGGIVGENLGVISNCRSAGSINGKHFAGGVAGYNDGTIVKCSNSADVNIEIRDREIDIETLDIRDIVGINLVSSEDEDTVSDVGGIAGISLGLIDSCTNTGTVGYQHYGYNVGGIAGRQSGQVQSCVNDGTVFGRKDVGGVVGQMEPYLILDGSSSLADEISALQAAMDKAMGDMSANSAKLGSSAQQVRDSGSNITRHYANQAIDQQSGAADAREKQEHREDFNDAASGAGSAVSDAAGGLSDDTISGIADGNLSDSGKQELTDAGTALASQGGTDLINRLNLLNAQREAELAALEAENARMRAEFASLSAGLNSMGRTIHSTLSGLAGDMQSVNAHYSKILTMFTNALSGNLQLRVMEDISDLDTDEDMNGKVLACINNGEINGDTDVGGIAGAMAVEAEFDLEGILSANITDTVQISTDSYFARCIVRKCVNNGAVTGKKDYNGGICGLAELGVISSSENYGDVTAGGNYCGGIVGQSKSIVTGSYAMCTVDGSEYVGGITGQGKRVVECSSIVELDETIACNGAICGWADSEDEDLFIYHNTFVSDTLGGVDGISYDQAAVPISYRELCDMEGLPERFRSLKVSFRADGIVIRELSVPYGGSVEAADIPAVPEIRGYSGFWPTTDLRDLSSSVTVDAVYLNRLTGLAADYRREGSELAVVIIEGLFEPGSSVSVKPWDAELIPAEHYLLRDALEVEISSHVADLESYSIHYLMPESSILRGKPVLCVRGEDGLEVRGYTVDGSYLVFDATGSDIRFCVLESEWDPTILMIGALAIALLLLILLLIVIRLIIRRRAKKAAAAAQEAAFTDAPAAETASEAPAADTSCEQESEADVSPELESEADASPEQKSEAETGEKEAAGILN